MKKIILAIGIVLLLVACSGNGNVVSVAAFGLEPDKGMNATPYVIKALEKCRTMDNAVLVFPKGRYDFYPDDKQCDSLFISAHDHSAQRYIGIKLEGIKNITVDGQGSDFMFHKYMIPIALIDCDKPTLKNFSIDFENPYFTQATVVESYPDYSVVKFEPQEPYSVKNNRLYITDDSLTMPLSGMNEFVANGKMLAWNSADKSYSTAEDLGAGMVRLNGVRRQPMVGNVLFMRSTYRPNPGVFSWRCRDMVFSNIDIHWTQGMGMLSQRCENIKMDSVNICIREGSGRYFTTIDALHFTACKGLISIENGLYENMLDDAVNIHGDYLQITSVSPDRKSITATYKHNQSFGYEAALSGESVQFINSRTMLPLGQLVVEKSRAVDPYNTELEFNNTLPEGVNVGDCIENLDFTPSVIYRGNTIRNNRARGALFSSPRSTVVENNTFDHCSGSAILLSSDCNSWFLSGACRDMVIRKNRFIHCMTSHFQYCQSVISIFPEIPTDGGAYHSNILIEDNDFTLFEPSALYARSVDSLVFRGNRIKIEAKYMPIIGESAKLVDLVRCDNAVVTDN